MTHGLRCSFIPPRYRAAPGATLTPMTPPPAAPEPTPLATVPLRWGDAASRWWAGCWLIVGGATLIAGSNEVALWALALGTSAHLAGWVVLPVAGWRRLLALPLSCLASYLLLAGP